MQFSSTRNGARTDLVGAVMQGLAPDGGLYVPDQLPKFDRESFKGETLPAIAAELLTPFFAGSPLADDLVGICNDALDFPVPLQSLRGTAGRLSVLELFHGPTAAFKDVGARFLAATMERVQARSGADEDRPLTILVATSGDTGSAVASAFHGRRGIRVGVLFPKGQVSARQRQQLTCWDENVRSFEVDGSFDDCQAVVKQAFVDPELRTRYRLSAANSINLGRLLPQAAYHAAAALWHWREHGEAAGSIIPTGNLGNALSCLWVQAMGLPVREVILAVNANRSITDFLSTGDWQPRPSLHTLASAMDVGNPSNMERLRHLIPEFDQLRESVSAFSVDDAAIREQIDKDDKAYGRVWCPHTATAFHVYDQLPPEQRSKAWIVSATAHPAKFESIVEPIVGHEVPAPPAMANLFERPSVAESLVPELDALASVLENWE